MSVWDELDSDQRAWKIRDIYIVIRFLFIFRFIKEYWKKCITVSTTASIINNPNPKAFPSQEYIQIKKKKTTIFHTLDQGFVQNTKYEILVLIDI